MKKPAYQRHGAARKKGGRVRPFVIGAVVLAFLLFFYTFASGSIADQAIGLSAGKRDVSVQTERPNGDTAVDAENGAPAVPDGAAPTEAPDTITQGRVDDWKLILVNPRNRIPEGYEISLRRLKNGHAVDERCYPDLQKMMDDCRTAGLSPVICSSYRTWEKQEQLFNHTVDDLTAQGYSETDARAEAEKTIAVPGTGEHQLGLAVDIVDVRNQNLDVSQEQTAVTQWMMQNSWKYGFILRYPSDKTAITGFIYEPWHYRYVGKEAAQYIYENGICLEEYIALLA